MLFADTFTVTIDITDDTIVEEDETVIGTLGNLSTGTVTGSPTTVTITDNDSATYSIAATDAAAGEPTGGTGGTGQYTVTLTAESSTDTVLSYGASGKGMSHFLLKLGVSFSYI